MSPESKQEYLEWCTLHQLDPDIYSNWERYIHEAVEKMKSEGILLQDENGGLYRAQ